MKRLSEKLKGKMKKYINNFTNRKKERILIVLFFLFSTLIFTSPLIFHLDSFSEYSSNFKWYDAPIYTYFVHYFKESILKFQFPIPIRKYFYPDGTTPTTSSIVPLYGFINAFISILTGFNEIILHNLFMIFSVFFSGLAMYLLIYEITKNKISSLAGGLIFISSKFLLTHLMIGHPDVVLSSIWIPLIFFYIEKSIKKPELKYGILLGILGTLQFLSSQQYVIYLTTILPLYIILRYYKILKNKNFLKLCFISIFLFFVFSSWYILFFITGKYYVMTIKTNLKYSVSSNDFINSNFLLLLFSLIGTVIMFKQNIKIIYPFFIIGIFTFLCSLGPFSTFAPYTFLYNFWLFYKAFRTPIYMIQFTMIFISISSGLFFSYINKKFKTQSYLLFFVLIVLLYFNRPQYYFLNDGFISYNDIKNESIEIYKTIITDTEDISIVEYPNECDPFYVFNIIFHNKNLVGGCATTAPESFNNFINACGTEILNVSNENCLYFIKNFNIKYVIYHSDKYENWNILYENHLKNSKFLKLEKEYKNNYVFKIEV